MSSLEIFKGQKAVVTGASGYIGAALVKALIDRSCSVISVSRGEHSIETGAITIKAEITRPEVWSNLIKDVDVVYHLAGNTSVYDAEVNPDSSLRDSLQPLRHLIKAANKNKSKLRVVFASTATVYGLTPRVPIDENTLPKPVTYYDLHKLFAEQQVVLASQQGIIEGISFRLSNVYGPSVGISSSCERGVINKLAKAAMHGSDLLIYGDGNYLRDYVYIDDVINAFIIAGFKKDLDSEVFNISSGFSVDIKQMFSMISLKASELTGKSINIRHVPWPEGVSVIEFRNYMADIKKANSKLEWSPKILLDTGILNTLSKIDFLI